MTSAYSLPIEYKVVLFTDQIDSTAHSLIRTHAEIEQVNRQQAEITTQVIEQCGGKFLNSTGDGAFLEFPSCRAAILWASVLQNRVDQWNAAQINANLRFNLHIGIDSGELIVHENGDLIGNASNRA